MVLIPPVWEKNDVYTNSDGDMVIDIWFSPAPMPANEGWFLDPAFAKSPYGLLIGQGLSSAERTVGGVTVVTPRTGIVDNELNYLITITHPWANSHIEYTQNLNQLQNQSG